MLSRVVFSGVTAEFKRHDYSLPMRNYKNQRYVNLYIVGVKAKLLHFTLHHFCAASTSKAMSLNINIEDILNKRVLKEHFKILYVFTIKKVCLRQKRQTSRKLIIFKSYWLESFGFCKYNEIYMHASGQNISLWTYG